jgi:hypothetical protein
MSKDKDTKSLKVMPGEKKSDEEKAKGFLKDHPEILYSARHLFHNKNGQTVVEENVLRGDLSTEAAVMPRTQYDLKDSDFQAISKHAEKIVDASLKEYDKKVAMEDALTRAIATLDDGKYANKVNATTYTFLLNKLVKA